MISKAIEQAVADRVYGSGAAVHLDDLVFGVPIFVTRIPRERGDADSPWG